MLLDRANTGASSAFCPGEDDSLCAQLYRCYAPGILAYLQRHVPTQEDAEDLLLDVFLSALEYELRLAGLSEDEHRAWLVTVARNKMIDHHRRASRRRFFSLEKAESTLDGEEKMPEKVLVRYRYSNGHDGQTLVALNTTNGKERWTYDFHDGITVEFAPAADNDQVYLSLPDNVIQILRASDGRPLGSFKAPGTVDPNNRVLLQVVGV